jgi:sugar-specific transcriptional regulator TrmB
MNSELRDSEFQRFWRRLNQVGLNAYEARTYMVLLGRPRFKALELAARAEVPRQKIYEVLEGLLEKGFASVIQEKTKLFSAVDPGLAVPNYVAHRHEELQTLIAEQGRVAEALVDDLNTAYSEGQQGRGTLDYLRIIAEPGQTAIQYRRMVQEAQTEYLEFARPPYAVDPMDTRLVIEARARGVVCRLLLEGLVIDADHRERLNDYQEAGVEVRRTDSLPMKLAVFDGKRGMIALLDPLVTRPAWTAVMFEHPGMSEAMKGLFEDYWQKARSL